MRKYMYMKVAVLSLVLMPITGAYAQGLDVKPYAGIGIGMFGLEAKGANGVTYNQNSTVFGGFGKFGVDVGDYFGAELRIGSTGSGTETMAAGTFGVGSAFNSTIKMKQFVSYLGKVQYPISQDLRVYGLFGGTTAKFQQSDKFSTESGSKTGFSYGFGGEYALGKLSVGGEWVQYWTNIGGNGAFGNLSAKVKMWGAVGTVSYRF